MNINKKQISITKNIIVMFLLVAVIYILTASVFASDSLNTIDVNGANDAEQNIANKNSSLINKSLDKDKLLKLFGIQMQYQDPSNAQDNTGESGVSAQVASFSALEQVTNISEGLSNLAINIEDADNSKPIPELQNMIDRQIQWQSEIEEPDENGKPVKKVILHTGKVKEIRKVNGEAIVIANDGENDYSVHPGDIMSISNEGINSASIISNGNVVIIIVVSLISILCVGLLKFKDKLFQRKS